MTTVRDANTVRRYATEVLGVCLERGLRRPKDVVIISGSSAAISGQQGLHRHDHWELFLPARRTVRVLSGDGALHAVRVGGVAVVTPGALHVAVHRVPQVSGWDCLGLTVSVGAHEPASLWRMNCRTTVCLTLPHQARVLWRTWLGETPEALLSRLSHDATAARWAPELTVARLRLFVAGLLATLGTTTPYESSESGDDRIRQVVAVLRARSHEPGITLESLGRAVGLSASRLQVLFRRETGTTVHQALVELRLRNAERLLVETEMPIKAIAAASGWSNPLYFSAVFRRRHGMSPSLWRRLGP